jgi:DNA replication protein DnaC
VANSSGTPLLRVSSTPSARTDATTADVSISPCRPPQDLTTTVSSWACRGLPKLIADLARGDFIAERRNAILAGPIGTGKTHLAIALGVEAARRRKHVAFYRAADFVRALVEARDARELGRLHKRLDRVDLLVLDEVGFVPFDRQGGELLLGVMTQRYQRRSIIVTTNLSFGEWPKILGGDEKLTTALLDRLADNAAVITTRGKSFRMRKRSGSAATAVADPASGA